MPSNVALPLGDFRPLQNSMDSFFLGLMLIANVFIHLANASMYFCKLSVMFSGHLSGHTMAVASEYTGSS